MSGSLCIVTTDLLSRHQSRCFSGVGYNSYGGPAESGEGGSDSDRQNLGTKGAVKH